MNAVAAIMSPVGQEIQSPCYHQERGNAEINPIKAFIEIVKETNDIEYLCGVLDRMHSELLAMVNRFQTNDLYSSIRKGGHLNQFSSIITVNRYNITPPPIRVLPDLEAAREYINEIRKAVNAEFEPSLLDNFRLNKKQRLSDYRLLLEILKDLEESLVADKLPTTKFDPYTQGIYDAKRELFFAGLVRLQQLQVYFKNILSNPNQYLYHDASLSWLDYIEEYLRARNYL